MYRNFSGKILLSITVFLSFQLGIVPSYAQKIATQDAGAGMKEELVYDAAGQIVETRTIGADGKLLTRNLFEFKPGFPTAQQKTVSYWPDGTSIKSVGHENYDQTANFIGEEIALFDRAGKQSGGHKIDHDPFTGIFQCWHWESNIQKYKTMECPAGEESGEPPAPLPVLTYEQAVKMSSDARQKALTEEKAARPQPQSPTQPSPATSPTEVAVILPAQLHRRDHITGHVVSDPARYDGVPGLMVVRMLPHHARRAAGTPVAIPSDGTSAPFSLADWTIEAPGAAPQSALNSFSFDVPASGSEFNITLRESSDSNRTVVHAIKVPAAAASAPRKTSGAFQATPLCFKNSVCVITGPFDGNNSQTFASFDSDAAPILAESGDTVYVGVPDTIMSGTQHLVVMQGPKVIDFPVCIAELIIRSFAATNTEYKKTLGSITLSHVADMPEAQWRAGIFPPGNLRWAQALVPGFKLPDQDHEARERQEKGDAAQRHDGRDEDKGKDKDKQDSGKEGMILVTLQNMTPQLASLHGAKNGLIALRLTDASFSNGDFAYKYMIDAAQAGKYTLKGTAIPFLAPVTGHELAAR